MKQFYLTIEILFILQIAVMAFGLLCSTSSFAECRSLNLGFVTIISGTTFEEQTSWVDNGTTFEQVTELVEVPCSAGNRWQWFWE